MLLINHYKTKIWIKPENSQSRYLQPGGYANIDGFKPPRWNGDWLKLSTIDKYNLPTGACLIKPDGNFIISDDYLYRKLEVNHPLVPYYHVFYNHLPGRKKDPYSTWLSEPKSTKSIKK